jgi:hypothetical protein
MISRSTEGKEPDEDEERDKPEKELKLVPSSPDSNGSSFPSFTDFFHSIPPYLGLVWRVMGSHSELRNVGSLRTMKFPNSWCGRFSSAHYPMCDFETFLYECTSGYYAKTGAASFASVGRRPTLDTLTTAIAIDPLTTNGTAC